MVVARLNVLIMIILLLFLIFEVTLQYYADHRLPQDLPSFPTGALLMGWGGDEQSTNDILNQKLGARLTDVVMPLHSKQVETAKLNMRRWMDYAPCLNTLKNPIRLTFYLSGFYNKKIEKDLMKEFEQLPLEFKRCFVQGRVRFANLAPKEDTYLMGSRLQFERMIGVLFNQDLDWTVSHVLYMEPDCIPIRQDWLVKLDEACRWPNEPFWIKGSIFRGEEVAIVNKKPYNMIHINGNALYNLDKFLTDSKLGLNPDDGKTYIAESYEDGEKLEDEEINNQYSDENLNGFAYFYTKLVRPYILKFYWEAAYDTDIAKYLLDVRNYWWSRQISSKFQFTGLIMNMYHTQWDLEKILLENPSAVLVHGGVEK